MRHAKTPQRIRQQPLSDLQAAVEAILDDSFSGVVSVCEVLGLTCSASYAWTRSNLRQRKQSDEELASIVRGLFLVKCILRQGAIEEGLIRHTVVAANRASDIEPR